MKPVYLLKVAAVCCTLFFAGNSNAQMVSGDVFLKGRYVEVGIGHLGYYGSDGGSPSAYHPHHGTRLGFVADPLMTGWSTSTTGPHYMGDYFVPGYPFEGWALQIGTTQCQGYNSGSVGSSLLTRGAAGSGSNISYSAIGSTVSGTWQGTFDSVDITQTTTLDTNNMYFSVKVILTNTAVAPKNNIYYFRSLDPDNDQTWPGGGFTTDNMINYQMPNISGVSAVTATGRSSMLPLLTLGTADTASRAVIYNSWPITLTTDLSTVYAQTYSSAFYNVGVNHPGDIAVGLIINIPHLATVDSAGDSVLRTTAGSLHPANSATLNYFYAFSAAGRDSAIAHFHADTGTGTSGGGSTLHIRNVNTDANIKVYPNPSGETMNITGLTTTDRVLVYDLMGRDMKQNWQVARDGTNTFRYDNLPAGAYVLVITDAGGEVKARVPVRKM